MQRFQGQVILLIKMVTLRHQVAFYQFGTLESTLALM